MLKKIPIVRPVIMRGLLRHLFFFFLPAVAAVESHAQDAAVRDAAEKYGDANALLWSHTERLRISFDDGRLTGRSEVTRDVLLLSDRAASLYNTDEVYHGFMHTLGEVEAATLVPSGDRYKTVKATEFKTTHSEEENIFFTDAKQTRVTYTNLSKYARTKLSYTINHGDVHFLSPFYFQSYMATREAIYTVTVPKSVKLGYRLMGLHTDKIKLATEEGRNGITYTWSVADMPRAERFSDAPSAPYYIPHVIVYVKSYTAPRSGEEQPVLGSVADLYHYFYGFIRNVNGTPDAEMAGIVDSLTKGVAAPREKASRIYGWVQDHLRYVAYEDSFGGYIPRPAAVVCSRRFGDCKDMTSVLVSMCRKAGLDAHFTWIGTRDIPYKYEELPLPLNDNHMICLVRMGEEWIFMDGTDRSIPFGHPPYHLQGKEALVAIDEKTYKVITVPVAAPEHNTVTDSTVVSIRGGDLEGDVRTRYTGYGAWRFGGMMRYASGNDKDKMLRSLSRRGSDKYTQTAADYSAAGAGKDFTITARFSLPDYAKGVDGETYVNLNLQRSYADDYVDKAVREVPIEYNYKQHLRQIVTLKIPADYKATYLPPDKADSDAGLWSYKLHYEQKGASIVLTKDFIFNTIMVSPAQFAAHNRLVEGLQEGYKESVVLTKAKK